MISALIRPRLLSIRNRWRRTSFSRRHALDLTILLLSIGVMVGLYLGTSLTLKTLDRLPFLVYVPPIIPLSLILFVLMVLTSLSAISTALGSFFFADDVELILATPAKPLSFFLSRCTWITITAAWMPFVFLFPILLGMSQHTPLGPEFVLYATLTLLPYFLIPISLAILLSHLVMAVIDARWTRFLQWVGLGVVLFVVLQSGQTLATLVTDRNDPQQIFRFVKTLAAARVEWSPSTWAAALLSELLAPGGKSITLRLALLWSTAVLCGSLAYLSFQLLHSFSYTRTRASMSVKRPRARATGTLPLRRALTPSRALIQKEFRTIFRDIAQSTQVLFVSGLCILYLTNARFLVTIDIFPSAEMRHWKLTFFVMHICISAFFTISLCTRLVFSSVSLEGRQFWLLQTAPITVPEIVRAKLLAWYRPIAATSAVIQGLGVYLIEPNLALVALFIVLSLFISYGIVALAIGLGAHFADFSWEHPSQLILSVGNVLFMLIGASMILFNVIPLSMILRAEFAPPCTPPEARIAAQVLGGVVVIIGNILLGRYALRLGCRSLEQSELL